MYKTLLKIFMIIISVLIPFLSSHGKTLNSVLKKKEMVKNSYPVVDTAQRTFFDNEKQIDKPSYKDDFYGQDACYSGNQNFYRDNGDGTITDEITGLMWKKEMGKKQSFEDARKNVRKDRTGGYSDWRIPTIKELYSLIRFTGQVQGQHALKPFIATKFFKQPLGNPALGEREIDAQTWSSTVYKGRTMRNDITVFGVNFVDGRIKGYPKFHPRTGEAKKMYFRYVRGNKDYGKNKFIDNGDGTVSDLSTGLMWQRSDCEKGFDWKTALKYAEDLVLAGHSDWRLPNAKELNTIVDYSRCPQVTGSAAIDPVFEVSSIKDSEGKKDFPYFWTGTTHHDGRNPYDSAVYFSFGEAKGRMHGRLMDVHGAGSQRSDPKNSLKNNYPQSFGPQGDIRRVYNYVRCVRDIR